MVRGAHHLSKSHYAISLRHAVYSATKAGKPAPTPRATSAFVRHTGILRSVQFPTAMSRSIQKKIRAKQEYNERRKVGIIFGYKSSLNNIDRKRYVLSGSRDGSGEL
jgi:hypothetical protein